MSLETGIKIIHQVQDGRFDERGERTDYIRVEFMVDKFGPFTERILKTDFIAGRRDEIINELARKVRV